MTNQPTTEVAAEARLAVVRNICRQEGHGALAEITDLRDVGTWKVYLCQRGCGVIVYKLVRPLTADEFAEFARRHGVAAVVDARVEVTA